MMSRIQITLEKQLHCRARRRAKELGVSFAEYVRRLVARDLGPTPAKADVRSIFDLGSSGHSDISKDKVKMIGEAFAFMLK